MEAAVRFREAAGDAALVFHRAFDQVEDQLGALEDLVTAGFDGVLTTGGERAANPALLRGLVKASAGRIKVIASGVSGTTTWPKSFRKRVRQRFT